MVYRGKTEAWPMTPAMPPKMMFWKRFLLPWAVAFCGGLGGVGEELRLGGWWGGGCCVDMVVGSRMDGGGEREVVGNGGSGSGRMGEVLSM